jgi:single-stranded-DNA-specific exonuclease
MVQLLYARGIAEPAQFEPFLAADEQLLGNPFLLPDMHQAVARVYRALLLGEEIAVFGDFDTDGIAATALLVQGLSALGGRVIPYIPHRYEEGYGLNQAALESLQAQGVSLVITVDCGISDLAEVEQGQRMGLDIIVTDHHSVPATIPPAIAVVDPKRSDSAYPFADLAGVGVAFKLLHALGRDKLGDGLLDLVALGTVADMVPLVAENRYLVKQGLRLLNGTERLGLREMMLCAGLEPGSIDSERIAWVLAPRLNAAGRLGHALVSYKLLVTESQEEARQLASELEAKNDERRGLTTEILAKAREQALGLGADCSLLLVVGEDYHAGVAGIVAGRLAEEFYRPSLVLELGEEVSRGSARSIPEFNIVAALRECGHLLSRFGGHPLAAGLTLPSHNISPLNECLLQMATAELAEVDLRPLLLIDAEVPLSRLDGESLKTVQQLAPFGYGNPMPTFLSRGVEVVDCRPVGNGGKHLRLKLRAGNVVWHGIGFELGGLIDEVTCQLDIVYKLGLDEWGDKRMLQLSILDFAPAAT